MTNDPTPEARLVVDLQIDTDGGVADREDQGVTVHLQDKTGEHVYFKRDGDTPQPITIRIAGEYSKRYRAIESRLRAQGLKRHTRALTDQQLMANRLELVAGCVLEWSGLQAGATPAPCTKENVLQLLKTAPWILRQLEDAQQDHASFFESASPS